MIVAPSTTSDFERERAEYLQRHEEAMLEALREAQNSWDKLTSSRAKSSRPKTTQPSYDAEWAKWNEDVEQLKKQGSNACQTKASSSEVAAAKFNIEKQALVAKVPRLSSGRLAALAGRPKKKPAATLDTVNEESEPELLDAASRP